ncbi:hypothetical protein CP02DC14_1824, partial [Chlamydia psittaci 02DC14]
MSRSKPAQTGQNRFEPVWSGLSRSKPVCGPVSGRSGMVCSGLIRFQLVWAVRVRFDLVKT